MAIELELPVEGDLPSLDGATAWLNSPPLTASGVRGRVVLVDFWTFTCINWIRTLPYLRAWSARYADQGLLVIGVHTPEFGVEHDVEQVRRAAREMGIEYAIAIDDDYAIWRAFGNRYWPALYIADARGRIRYHHFGEGAYERSEQVIQRALAEAGAEGIGSELVSVEARGVEAPADWGTLNSPETYVGYLRAERFASPGGARPEERRAYTAPEPLALNHWALDGDWRLEEEAAASSGAGGRIVVRFEARDLHLVMAADPGSPGVRFRVLLDGAPPGEAAGSDVDEQGHGTVTVPRLYQLVRQPGPVIERTFEIAFLDPGVRGYVFTFG